MTFSTPLLAMPRKQGPAPIKGAQIEPKGQASPLRFWAALCLLGALLIANRFIGSLELPWPLPLVERDFTNLWFAGRLAIEGQISVIFDPDAFRTATQRMLGTKFSNNYSYPPHALFLAMPFGLLSYPAALLAWNAASLGFFY